MALPTQPYKGARDFYPEDKRLQDYLFNVMRNVVESYGYEAYDAPILEPLELYKAKTGDEIVNEQTYTFTDRGGREVAIRPEMTPTVSRMVAARRQELAYPLRWYSIPNLWRYERPQRGRLREHWQLNVDIFGDEGIAAEHEVISVADNILKKFGASADMYQIKLNSRKLIDMLLLEYFSLSQEQAHKLIKLIDRMHKMDATKFNEALLEICSNNHDLAVQIQNLLKIEDINDLPKTLQQQDSCIKLCELMKLLDETGVKNAVFDITLMRGFDYYTDIVFEVFDTNPENNRSMFGGGRYDGLVGLFGVEPVATVGFGMGDVTLANFLEVHNLMPAIQNGTHVQILTIGDVYPEASKLADNLRGQNLRVAIDATERKIDKKIKTASKLGIKYVLFVGQDELSESKFPLKDLSNGSEDTLSINEIAEKLKN